MGYASIKIGYHESKISSGKDFIDNISPKYLTISASKNNRYGYSNSEVIDKLNKKIYRTDVDGSVMFEISKDKINISACPP